jgi:hypothetical protein
MMQEQSAETLPLIAVYNGEGDLCPSRLDYNATRSTHNHRPAVLIQDGYQRQMVDEIGV